jgi:uncharacterized protein YrrD
MKNVALGTALTAVMLAGGALAQNQATPDMTNETGNVDVLSEWSYDSLYATGWSVENLLDDAQVLDTTGEAIGTVEDVIFRDNGEVLALIAEVGGFWDIGDTHVSVPWTEVKASTGSADLTIPVSEDNLDQYTRFDESGTLREPQTGDVAKVEEGTEVGEEIFRASDLVGDYAYLDQNTRHGYVNDLIVNEGKLAALVVESADADRRGYFAYPYEARDWRPGSRRYDLPYASGEIAQIENFDYDRIVRSDQTSTSSTKRTTEEGAAPME